MFIKGPLFMMTQTLTLYKIAAIDLWYHWYDKNVKRFPTNLYWTTVIMDSGRNNLDKTSASFMSDSFSPTFTLFISPTSPKAVGFRLLFFQSWMAFLTFRDDISLGSCQRDGTSALCKYMCVHTHTHVSTGEEHSSPWAHLVAGTGWLAGIVLKGKGNIWNWNLNLCTKKITLN